MDGSNSESAAPQNLSSISNDYVIFNYNDSELANALNDVHLTGTYTNSGQHTYLDEHNLVLSWEQLKEENNNLRGQLRKMNESIMTRIKELQEMKDNQSKWKQMNDANYQRAKDETIRLQNQVKLYKNEKSTWMDLEQVMKDLTQLLEKDIDAESKQHLQLISQQIKDVQTTNSARTQELSSKVAEMNEQLKCKDEQLDLMATKLSEMEERVTNPTEEMVLVSQVDQVGYLRSSSIQDLESVQSEEKSVNAQLEDELASLQKLNTKNQEEIRALKLIEMQHKKMHQDKSRELEVILENMTKLEKEKKELEVTNTAQERSGEVEKRHVELLVGSAPATRNVAPQQNLRRVASSGEGSTETMQNLLVLYRSERQKCSTLQENLRLESRRFHELEMEMLKLKQDFNLSSTKYEKEISKREKEHQLTVEDLAKELNNLSEELKEAEMHMGEPQYYQSAGDDIRALKSQVIALMEELGDMNTQVEEANIGVQRRNERIKTLEMKNAILESEQHNQTLQDTAIIDRMQEEIKRLMAESSITQEERDQWQIKYQQLLRKFEEVRQQAEAAKDIDQLTATLMSSEEALHAQNMQLLEQSKQIELYTDQIPALEAQAEIYKVDFEAERSAREAMHSEKDNLIGHIKRQQDEIEQMREELNPHTQAALENLQRRYAGMGSAAQVPANGQATIPRDTAPVRPAMEPLINQFGHYFPVGHGPVHQPPADHEAKCPVCQRVFPDIDTLQIHVMECID